MQRTLRAGKLYEDVIRRRRHRLHDDDKDGAELVPQFPARAGAARHHDAQRQAQRQRDGQRDQPHLQGNGYLFCHDLGDGHALAEDVRFAQIALKDLLYVVPQLHGQRVFQAQIAQLDVDLRLRELVVVLKVALDGHQAQQRKDDDGDDEHRDRRAQHALEDVFCHETDLLGGAKPFHPRPVRGADAKVSLPCRVQAGGRGAPAGERRLPSPVFRGVAAARAVEQRPGRLSGWEDLSAYSAAAAASASSRSVSQVW